MQTLQVITINGKQAVVLVPEIADNLAVVDMNVLKRLASLLPTARLGQLKEDMIDKIRNTESLEGYVGVLKDEVAFHMSVNLIQEFNPNDLREG